MVELEQRPVEFLTFERGDITANVPAKNFYTTKDVTNTLALLGIKQNSTKTYDMIGQLPANSEISNPNDRRVVRKLTQDDLRNIIELSIQKHESPKNIRAYAISSEATIELRGITDYKWKICEPLLNELRSTRKQTEEGVIQTTPLAYKIVKSFFPESAALKQLMLYTIFPDLNRALAPSGWSVVREGQGPKKSINAPWFLRGPDDNGVYDKGVPKAPNQENMYDSASTFTKEKKRAVERAVKQFDRMAFGTSLLHLCLSNLTNPGAKTSFTKNLAQAMSRFLPIGLKLQDVIGKETPQEYFQELIRETVNNSMVGKSHEDLPEKQQEIMPLWNQLKIESGQRPDMVIFEHFNGHSNDL